MELRGDAQLMVPSGVRFFPTHVQVGARSFRLPPHARDVLEAVSSGYVLKDLTVSPDLPGKYLGRPDWLRDDIVRLAEYGLIAIDGKTAPQRQRADPLALLIQRDSEEILRAVTALSRISINRFAPVGPVAAVVGLLLVAVLVTGFDPARFAFEFAALPPFAVLLMVPVFFLVALHHEAGHVAAANRLSCHVGRAGIGVYLTSLVLFVDLTSLHKVEPRRRILADLGGIANDVVLFAAATAAWALLWPENHFLHDLLTVSAVSCLLFELNPWARGDGAWCFKDLATAGHQTSLWLTNPRTFIRHALRPGSDPVSRSYLMQLIAGGTWAALLTLWSGWMASGMVAAAQLGPDFLVRLGLQLATTAIGAAGLSRVAYQLLKRRAS